MNKFDLIEIKLPPSVCKVKPFFASKFVPSERKRWGVFQSSKVPESLLSPGINEISVIDGAVVATVTAKILGEQHYKELINQKTIPIVLKALSEFLDFESEDFKQDAEVQQCHVTDNSFVTKPVWHYLKALACISNPDYKLDTWKLKETTIETVTFRRRYRGKQAKELLKAYDKETEIRSKGKKDKFYRLIPKLEEFTKSFKGVLRVELELPRFDLIRKAFNLPPGNIKLMEVLKSEVNPLADFFQKICRCDSGETTDEHLREASFVRYEKSKGMDGIIQECNFDMNIIASLIKKTIKGTPTKTIQRYRRRVEELKFAKIADVKPQGLLDQISVWLKYI